MMNFFKRLFHRKIISFYVSQIDQFLVHLRRKFPKLSLSQQEEITKFDRIFRLRDRVVKEQPRRIWHKF